MSKVLVRQKIKTDVTLDTALGLKIENNSKMTDFLKATERIALLFLFVLWLNYISKLYG